MIDYFINIFCLLAIIFICYLRKIDTYIVAAFICICGHSISGKLKYNKPTYQKADAYCKKSDDIIYAFSTFFPLANHTSPSNKIDINSDRPSVKVRYNHHYQTDYLHPKNLHRQNPVDPALSRYLFACCIDSVSYIPQSEYNPYSRRCSHCNQQLFYSTSPHRYLFHDFYSHCLLYTSSTTTAFWSTLPSR